MIFLKKYWGLVFVVLFSLFSILPFLSQGFFPMHDDTQVVRVYEMGKSLKDGMFPVRWVTDLGYGYGYPIFNFYAPLAYYVGGFFNVLGIDALVSTKAMMVLGIVFSGIFMYFLAREFKLVSCSRKVLKISSTINFFSSSINSSLFFIL